MKGQKVKLLDWIKLKIKLNVVSNLFIHRCKIVAIKICIISSMYTVICPRHGKVYFDL